MLRATALFFAMTFLFSMPLASGTSALLLRDGGIVEGELLNSDEYNRRTFRVRTAEGLEISLDTRLVERIQGRERAALIEYNRDAPLTANTVEGHLYWARWCIEHHLPDRARIHWRQILELDPEHGDARRNLGYTQTSTGWESIQGRNESQGRILDRGRWRTAQEIEVENFLESQRQARQFWQGRIRELLRRLPNPHAEAELLSIRDPAAVIPIGDALLNRDGRNPLPPQARMILIRTLAQISDIAAVQTMAAWSVHRDEIAEIRRMCIEELQRRINEQPEVRQIVVSVYRNLLRQAAAERSPVDQVVVNLVAEALGRVGGHEAVPELIELLVITVAEVHREQAQGPTFSSGGSSRLQQGTTVRRNMSLEQMPIVLTALRRLTGSDFGFNQDLWRDWYRQHYRSPHMDLRRG